MPSPNLQIADWIAQQEQPEETVKAAIDQLDNASNADVAIDCTAGGTIVVTAAQYRNNMVLSLFGTPGAGFNLTVPDGGRFFAVLNNTGQTASVDTTTGGDSEHAPITVLDQTTVLLFSLNTDLIRIAG